MSDAIDAIVGQWTAERPELADRMWPVQLVGRIQRLNRIVEREVKSFLAAYDLEFSEFDVLTSLRRSGPPYELTAGAFLKAAMVTSGAITNRIDRMEGKGLVERVRDPADRRQVRIRLTPQGRALIDEVVVAHFENLAGLLTALDREETEAAAVTLRALLESLGDTSIA
ncbi:MarR family winged helix-turn-helix transcriptional regulator [Streptomyces sp. WAC06614]|uniref:MarR family winged helix-turn-helix transcriptional regulator n=1 Tax=Streptomyces sp. WAC06614 TaxID=2487416 RepID=UPI000F790C76|nr:MarR family transcriptional regulator [Streptomyces sp. WAC06614]RSS84408.1 MarR family transcriptional regulator [Streptomyces sp. WAC06614]